VAPMVMAFLGRKKQSDGLDAGGIAKFLIGLVSGGRSTTPASGESAPGGLLGGIAEKLGGLGGGLGGNMGGLVETAKGFIDKDKDGDIMDDLQGMLGGLIGGK
jgi:hypothetical protein